MVFARNHLCQVPGQQMALPVLVWVKTAELLISRVPPRSGDLSEGEMPEEERSWFQEMLRTHLSAAATVRQMMVARGGTLETLAKSLSGSASPASTLTEADGGPQSICIALAATCFGVNAAPIWTKADLERATSRGLDRANSQALSLQRSVSRTSDDDAGALWPRRLRRLALCLLAEAVSRGCRKLVRSLASAASEEDEAEVFSKLLWDALGIDAGSVLEPCDEAAKEPPERTRPEAHVDECDTLRAQRRSALLFAPQGKHFQAGLTNCTPQGIVGTLMIHFALRSAKAGSSDISPCNQPMVEELTYKLWKREISMKAFVEAVLPGDVAPGAVQAALYAQGLRYHTSKERRGGLLPLSQPDDVLRALAREQRYLAYLARLRAKLQQQAAGNRTLLRAQGRREILASFLPAHSGLPKLFRPAEVDELNAKRLSAGNRLQLELLPTGLLKHHCCFPQCPQYLQDLGSEADARAESAERKGVGSAVLANRRYGLFEHLAPMMWAEVHGKDAYIPLLHSASQAGATKASQAGKSANGDNRVHHHICESLKRLLKGRPAEHEASSDWLVETVQQVLEDLHKLQQ
ncbi:unnamed protein product [Polarella glacialis]|uniref:Uncharacterized protein n=1 Tax=Polarella glacialis TaxID=89957 RepID=A0A813EGL5_POLGL|nr:unnamed protein product [Polarella glacialis]